MVPKKDSEEYIVFGRLLSSYMELLRWFFDFFGKLVGLPFRTVRIT
jgi:hypothetical protein